MRTRKAPKSQSKLLKLEQDMEDAVRIFPFQQFDNVTEVPLGHVVSAEAVDNGLFVTPTAEEKINLFGIEEKLVDNKATAHCSLISEFNLVSRSRAVHYLPYTGWLLSLEHHPDTKTVARVYFNWRSKPASISCRPDRDSIGDIIGLSFLPSEKLLPSDEEYMKKIHQVNYIDMPADRNVRRVSVCPTTNRIAFATRNHIRIWCYTTERMELVYTIKVDFDIKTIDLYDEYLAYASGSEVRVIRVCVEKGPSDYSSIEKEIIIDDSDPNRSSPMEPFTPIEDDHMIECSFSATTGASLDPKRILKIPTAGARSSRTSQGSRIPSNASDSTFEVLGPSENTHCISSNYSFHYFVKSCVVLVHRQFSSKAFLHTVHFLPEFHLIPEHLGISKETPPNERRARILRNIKNQTHQDDNEIFEDTEKTIAQINTARSVRCMIGTSRKGYLYDVSDPRLLSEYSFTEHTVALKMTSSVMYTLTQTGLIMWSIRCCSSAGEQFPAPCVLGIEIIKEPRHLTIVGDYLLVTPILELDDMEKNVFSNNPTTILRTKSLLSLFDEIRAFAKLNEEKSYESYFQLMLELHFLLEAKLQSLNQRLMQTDYYSSIFKKHHELEIDPEKVHELDQLQIESALYHEKHKESSGALGDYQFHSEYHSRAAVFYADSDRMMSTIIEPMLKAATSDVSTSARRGILHYLDALLFNPDKKPIIDETPEISDKILAIYHTFARGKLASIILESSLSKYNQETALRLLEDARSMRAQEFLHVQRSTSSSSPVIAPNLSQFQSGLSLKNIFVRGLLYLDLGQPEQAAEDFLSLEPEVLIDFCAQNPQLLHLDLLGENSTCDRPSILAGSITQEANKKNPTLGQLLYSSDPWPFLDILVRVIDHVPVSSGLHLLKSNCIEDLSEDMLFLLENYLEWVLVHGYATKEAYECLTLIYANHILSPNQRNEHAQPSPESLPHENRKPIRQKWTKIHRDSFVHQRADWLNQIEPFDTVNLFASRSPFASDDEPLPPMFYLQKLQGLLSDDNLIFPGTIKPLLSKVFNEKTFEGKMSLELLCLPLADKLMTAMEKVVASCPHITCLYAVKYCKTNSEWKSVLDFLSESITSCQVYTEIISHLVRNQDPVTFVSLLPENGNMKFFLPFIEQCFRCHYAAGLKQSIVNQAKSRVGE